MGVAFSDFPNNALGYISGQIVDHSDNDLISMVLDEACAPGLAVQVGSSAYAAEKVKDGGTPRGIVAYSFPNVNNASGAAEYGADKEVTVVRRGRVAVTVADGCSVDGAVYAVPGTGAIVSTSTNNVAIPGAYFVTAAQAGGVAIVQL